MRPLASAARWRSVFLQVWGDQAQAVFLFLPALDRGVRNLNRASSICREELLRSGTILVVGFNKGSQQLPLTLPQQEVPSTMIVRGSAMVTLCRGRGSEPVAW